MCGIHGFAWKDDAAAGRMTAAAAHRGPDGSSRWADDRVTLAHNLLAVSDSPGRSAQPWHHGSGVLAFNGEVYNYHELRRRLKHKCRTDSDTEVLAAGLAEKGVDFLRDVDGMYALAWYDWKAGTLTLARDTNGSRPLYAGFLNDRPAFSSEVRSLLALGFPRVVSKQAFRHYYHSGLVAGPLTMFEGIFKLVPGQVVTFNLDTRDTADTNLNDRPVAPYAGDPAEVPERLRDALRQSVRMTTSTKRRTGLFLSGGMDSSAVLYEAAMGLNVRPRTFSSRFALPHKGCRHNEDAEAGEFLGKMYGTKHRESWVDEGRWVEYFEPAVLAMEEPRQGRSHPAYYACNKQIRMFGVVVTLSGDGGDELLMGYKHQLFPPFRNRLESLRAWNRPLADPSLDMTLDEQATYLDGWLPRGGLTGDAINDHMYTECLHTLAEDFLVRNDKLGAAFGMESRFPMLCKPFRDLARSLPGKMKAGPPADDWSTHNKYLLRKAYAGKLPTQITSKSKTGWRAPTDDWIVGCRDHPASDGPVRQYVRSVLADKTVRDLFGLTDDVVENRFLNNRDFVGIPKLNGKPGVCVGLSAQKELFSILTFAVWLKAFNMRLW